MARRHRGWAPPEDPRLADRVFGGVPIAGTANDLLWLLDGTPAATLPALYLCCGTGDPLLEDNVRFADACRANDVAITAEFGAGEHEWGYWDARIQDVLAWLPLAPPAGQR
jgi:S-formylglutathione hydrolase FrmB